MCAQKPDFFGIILAKKCLGCTFYKFCSQHKAKCCAGCSTVLSLGVAVY
jgi:hypothetical protein